MNREQRAKIATAIQLHVSICMFAAQVIVFLLHSIRVLQSIFDAGSFFTRLGALYPSASEHLVQP